MKYFFYILLLITTPLFAKKNKTTKKLLVKLHEINNNQNIKIWIYFTDKGNSIKKYFRSPELVVSKKSLLRRAKIINKKELLDFRDIPVYSKYVQVLASYKIKIHHRSRWFNAVSAYADKETINRIQNLSFIKKIDLVQVFKTKNKDVVFKGGILDKIVSNYSHRFDYGKSLTQLQQINVPAVQDLGYTGQGITICLMDAGFNNLEHEVFANLKIIAQYDFVNNDNNVDDENDMGNGSHGTETLSTIGGFSEGNLIGPAFNASFILAKTENTDSETPAEEDNWIAAVEWADSIGVDVTSTSLGYLEMDPGFAGYTWKDMDGNTATITNGADLAAARGIVVVNSAGNNGFNSLHNTLGAPADGDSVIAVGAVNSLGGRISFSSVGPTVDGRIKPDIMAMGSNVFVASPYSLTGYALSSGTSFSCPLAAGVAALVLCANPNLTPMQVRDALRNTASQSSKPDNLYGWGIVNALAAVNYYKIKISHQPLKDTEDENRINTVLANFTSILPIETNNLFIFYSNNNFTTIDSLQFTYTGINSRYSAVIPKFQNLTTVEYYIKAVSRSGGISFLPVNAPKEYFKFTVGPDNIPPSVFHNPLQNISLAKFPINISVIASDNIAVDSVSVIYKINEGGLNHFTLADTESNIYTGNFPIAADDVVNGDSISYRIVVNDSANVPNTTVLPSDTTFFTFTIVDSLTDVAAENNLLPTKFVLEQNYPNPFNPSTIIKYSVPVKFGNPKITGQKLPFLQLKIYNLLGQEIAILIDKQQQPGNYQITFNASDLPSGVYIYKLSVTAGSLRFAEAKKMVLLK